MAESTVPTAAPTAIPADDPDRSLTLVSPEGPGVRHVSVVGDTYTLLVSGAQTAGRYCLIDMRVPDGGGPPPHRHDFEEMFTLLEGSIDFTFRGEVHTVTAGSTVNIPANAPHFFRNTSGAPARMLCLCTPAGQEDYFAEIGVPVDGPTAPPPDLSEEEQAAGRQRAAELAPAYRTELLV